MNTYKDYFKRVRSYLVVSVIIVTSSGMLSCGTGPDPNQDEQIETPEHAVIRLGFNTISNSLLVASGEGLDSAWDSELGIVTINMNESLDGSLDRYGSFNLFISPDSIISNIIRINNAIISTSSCLICEPGEQVNGKLYTRIEGDFDCNLILGNYSIITDSFISADRICIEMVESESREEVKVVGSFIAIDENSRYFNQ